MTASALGGFSSNQDLSGLGENAMEGFDSTEDPAVADGLAAMDTSFNTSQG